MALSITISPALLQSGQQRSSKLQFHVRCDNLGNSGLCLRHSGCAFGTANLFLKIPARGKHAREMRKPNLSQTNLSQTSMHVNTVTQKTKTQKQGRAMAVWSNNDRASKSKLSEWYRNTRVFRYHTKPGWYGNTRVFRYHLRKIQKHVVKPKKTNVVPEHARVPVPPRTWKWYAVPDQA